jgi:anti-sigma28 factor (negative regulator of flagellin synthesis)
MFGRVENNCIFVFMENTVVYIHKRKDTNEVFYVGIGKIQRPYHKSKRNKYWKSIVNKHGYDIEIIHKDLSWENACKIERQLISQYGRLDLGTGILVNMTDGGEGNQNIIYTDEWREKQRIASTGRIQTEETKKKRALRQTGIKFSKDRKKNISKSKKGTQVGSNNPSAVLSEDKVSKIKELIRGGKSILSISKLYGCGWTTISRIKKGTHWSHVI